MNKLNDLCKSRQKAVSALTEAGHESGILKQEPAGRSGRTEVLYRLERERQNISLDTMMGPASAMDREIRTGIRDRETSPGAPLQSPALR